jgi:hypothetical protein
LRRLWVAFFVVTCVACPNDDGTIGDGNKSDVLAPDVAIDGKAMDFLAADLVGEPCLGTANGTACDDGDACTLDDQCSNGLCVGGKNNPCESVNPCVLGTCDSELGCDYQNTQTGTSCSMACFGTALCVEGECQAVEATKVECPEPSEDDHCVVETACDVATGECTLKLYASEGTNCDVDNSQCTKETCDAAGACASTGDVENCQEDKLSKPCELWACAPKNGKCVSAGFAGEISCIDGNGCTFNDTCAESEFGFIICQGTPIPVGDKNPCTDDACLDGTVTHTPINGLLCDPQDGCTDSGLCDESVCIPSKICNCIVDADCPFLEDKCAGDVMCIEGICSVKPGTSTQCAPSEKSCQEAVCVPETGECIDQPVEDGVACDDGSVCTTPDSCQAGVCLPGETINCGNGIYCDGIETCDSISGCVPGKVLNVDDGVACTTDVCDEALDQILHTLDDAKCSDPILCTQDICTEVGCAFEPVDANCDNGLFCDGVESCDVALGCVTTQEPVVDDGIECTIDACDEDLDAVVHATNDNACKDLVLCTDDVCTEVGCLNTANDANCDDGLFCNGSESCDGLLGCVASEAPETDDGVDCTEDACDEELNKVTHLPIEALCDDGFLCTLDVCTAQGCAHTDSDEACDDGSPCTDDTCTNGVCSHTYNKSPCDDGDACSIASACDQGACVATQFKSCTDGDPCTADTCTKGVCEHTASPGDCDDGNPCTSEDFCSNGACLGGGPAACTDGNACTNDGCDPAVGCTYTNNADSCDDGDACSLVDACEVGICVGSQPPDCDDGNECTTDSCNVATGCVSTKNLDFCDDGDVCTDEDTCSNGSCIGGASIDCDDGNECTDDGCDAVTGCVTTANTILCDDNDDCSFEDSCKGGKCLGWRYSDGKVEGSVKISKSLGGLGAVLKDYDSFGYSAAGIGDLNGDGIPDMAVGAPNDDDGGNGVGAVWILFLDDEGKVSDSQKISTEQGAFQGALFSGDLFGSSIASLGDLNGDGVVDLAVGATGDDGGASGGGAIWILFMNTDGTVKIELEITSGQAGFAEPLFANDSFGASVAAMGDLDGDGNTELAVGLPGRDGALDVNEGAVWILYLKKNGAVKSVQKLQDVSGTDGANADFGVSLTKIGDLNGDQVPELAVGASDSSANYGALWILFMNANGSLNTQDGPGYLKLSGGLHGAPAPIAGVRFGGAVAGMGDLDGDNIPDLTASSWAETNGCNECGTVWTLFLNSDGSIKKKVKLGQGIPQTGFKGPLYGLKPHWGRSLALVGDVNLDGLPEFVAGANEDDVSQGAGCSNCGAAFLVFLNEDPLCAP